MKSPDKSFVVVLGGLLLCAFAPAFLGASNPGRAGVAVIGGAICFSLLSLVVRAVFMELNVFGCRDRANYLDSIDTTERFLGRPMSAGERARFDRVYWY